MIFKKYKSIFNGSIFLGVLLVLVFMTYKKLSNNIKMIDKIYNRNESHWVGDGFPVKTMFSYSTLKEEISPFVLLDYNFPFEFTPSKIQRGVGDHPHRGFETVSIIYQGEVEHADNKGNTGKIVPGDVQWMTAGRGIIHRELHSKKFSETGGVMEGIQLWVNLPKKHKMTAPKYQEITKEQIPVVKLDENGSQLRIISGEYGGMNGAASTFTPVNLWDIRLEQNADVNFELIEKYTTAIFVMHGNIIVNDENEVKMHELALFKREGGKINVKTKQGAKLLFLYAEPLNEPIVGHGPFVMNSGEEIRQAFHDFNSGTF